MKYIFCLWCLTGWGCLLSAQKNVVLIIADDLGKDYCGFYEEAGDTANMPHVRSLLSRGVRFTNAWATPLCSPTRAGLLTGRYGFRTSVGAVVDGPDSGQLDTAEITIPKLLKQLSANNYATANIGKWHLNTQSPQNQLIPNQVGYDHFEGPFLGELSSYYDWKKVKNGVSSNVTTYATTETVNNAIAWLDNLAPERPFFMWLAFNAPHTPFHKPPDNLHTVSGLTGTTMHINQHPELYFKAATEAMDTEIGRLFDWLQAHGEWEDTHVIFIGDNGNSKRVAQIADTTHVKGTLYEYGINVPFIIAGPSVVSPGRKSDALVSTPDLYATILELAGVDNWADAIPAARPVDAKSLLPILEQSAGEVRDWSFSELFTIPPVAADGKAIRDKDYKLIRFDNGTEAFFRLETDPQEAQNLLNSTLSAAAQQHYQTLCTALANLLGQDDCQLSGATETVWAAPVVVYPSPTSGILRITLPGSSLAGARGRLIDAQGRIVHQFESDAAQVEMDISACATGIYRILLEQGGNIRILSFVKE